MISTGILFLWLLLATVTDVTAHRIYNWNTYSGILLAFVLSFWLDGWSGLQESLAGFVVCGGLMLLCFVLSDLGGGDVKLVAMMGAFLGVHAGIEALLWTFVLGAMLGLVLVIWRTGIFKLLAETFQHLRLVIRSRSWVPLTQEDRRPLKGELFLAPASLMAVCIVTRGHFLPL